MKLGFWQIWFSIVGTISVSGLLMWAIAECESRYGPRVITIAFVCLLLLAVTVLAYSMSRV